MNPIRSTVSVIICAYTLERWDDLLAGIHSLFGQTRLPSEVIVVIDHNPELLERVRSNIPNIILIENTGPVGVSSARNAGVAAAKGELLAFLDDDAVAHPDWLAKLCYWCDQPFVLGAGSKINPIWTKSRPRWFPDEFGWVLGYSHKGLPEKVEKVRNFFGAGMCIRREVFEKVGNFRSELGRVHKLPVGCEETELCIRVLQRIPEGKLIYAPDSIVNHRISPSRINWHYFQHRCYSEGLSKATMSRFVGMSDGLSSERSYTFRILPRGIANGVADAFLRGDWSGLGRAFAILMGFTFTVAGYIAESLKYEIERLKNHEDRLQNLYN
jgi:GT2 family glycosyltransferase